MVLRKFKLIMEIADPVSIIVSVGLSLT